jgi:hypothetical protein
MAKGIRESLAQRFRRIDRGVLTLKKIRNNPSSDREILSQELIGDPQEMENIAVNLAVIDELRLIDAFELR